MFNVVVPTAVPVLWFSESLSCAFFISCVLRYVISLHATWLVNSAAHKWGNRPYDLGINPAENMFVCSVVMGEGFHNYHHTFPHDYSTSEFGWRINPTTMFIDVMSWVGLAYDRKTISKESVLKRRHRTGDMSHSHWRQFGGQRCFIDFISIYLFTNTQKFERTLLILMSFI